MSGCPTYTTYLATSQSALSLNQSEVALAKTHLHCVQKDPSYLLHDFMALQTLLGKILLAPLLEGPISPPMSPFLFEWQMKRNFCLWRGGVRFDHLSFWPATRAFSSCGLSLMPWVYALGTKSKRNQGQKLGKRDTLKGLIKSVFPWVFSSWAAMGSFWLGLETPVLKSVVASPLASKELWLAKCAPTWWWPFKAHLAHRIGRFI